MVKLKMTEQEYEAFKEFINKVLYEQMTEDDYMLYAIKEYKE